MGTLKLQSPKPEFLGLFDTSQRLSGLQSPPLPHEWVRWTVLPSAPKRRWNICSFMRGC